MLLLAVIDTDQFNKQLPAAILMDWLGSRIENPLLGHTSYSPPVSRSRTPPQHPPQRYPSSILASFTTLVESRTCRLHTT